MRFLQRRDLLSAGVFVASALVLALQLITPSPVMVTIGETGTKVVELGGYFRYSDVAIIAVSACLLGVSGTYLLVGRNSPAKSESPERLGTNGGKPETKPSDELLEARRQEWEETAERLAKNEREIYETVLEADGVLPQSDIVEQTDLSKATVSRALDSLEIKDLVERKQRGMGNVVILL